MSAPRIRRPRIGIRTIKHPCVQDPADPRYRNIGEDVVEMMENDPADWSKVGAKSHPPRRANDWHRLRQDLLWACSLAVILYSIWVLIHVASMGTIGVRCMFGT